MTHFKLGGYGLPIPESADVEELDPRQHPELPVQSFVLSDGDVFRKADWTSLGYNYFEVWCVGGGGGNGGDVGRQILWPYRLDVHPEVMPGNIYTAWKEGELYKPDPYKTDAQNRAQYYHLGYWHQAAIGEKPPISYPESEDYRLFGGWTIYTGWLTFEQYARYQASFIDWPYSDPYHYWAAAQSVPPKAVRRYIGSPMLVDDGAGIGGAGGGGGVHKVFGALADIPDEVPVAIGRLGASAPVGHLYANGPFTPSPGANGSLRDYTQDRGDYGESANPTYSQIFRTWRDVFEGPSATYYPPVAGQDGGPTSFGSICMASGGKGGGPAYIWIGGQPKFHAHGGDGGKGGRLVAGGGGVGFANDGAGYDYYPGSGGGGSWDGSIGGGGGGGRGGSSQQAYKYMYIIKPVPNPDANYYYVQELTNVYGGYANYPLVINRNGSEGGPGAYSNTDTSVATVGGFSGTRTHPYEYGGSFAHSAIGHGEAIPPPPDTPIPPDWLTGGYAKDPEPPTLNMFPGSGGGARVNRKYYVGSYASKTDGRYLTPNGFVLLRLLKLGDD